MRDRGLVVAGSALSAGGTSLTMLAVVLVTRPLGAAWVSAALVVQLLPAIAGAPLAGLIVDRVHARRLLIAAELVQAAASCGLALALHTMPPFLACLGLLGAGEAITGPAASALVPALVEGERATARAFGQLTAARTTMMLVGFAGGGALIAGAGPTPALVLDGVTFAVQAVLLVAVRADRRPSTSETAPGVPMWEGLCRVAADPLLRAATVGQTAMVASATLMNVAEVFLVTTRLGGGPGLLGVLGVCWGAGMVVGARCGGSVHTDRALMVALAAAGLCLAGGLAAPTVLTSRAVTAAGWVVGGVANGAIIVLLQTLVCVRTPEPFRGRVNAVVAASTSLATLAGTGLAAPLVASYGPVGVLGLAACGTLVGTAVLVVLLLPARRGARWRGARALQTQGGHCVAPAADGCPQRDMAERDGGLVGGRELEQA